ncbi:head-tail connector protein [Rhizobium sp.]|uniref:head-tail connector protein n=1 Tax=Rhizobium sp. TaxID=391 RepID=UPI00289D497E
MWYPPKLVTPPTEPLTADDAKRQCVVLHDDDDTLFEGLIAAARDYVEKYTGTLLAPQTVEVKCDCFADMARLSIAPVTSVSIEYIDTASENQTIADADIELRADGLEASVVPAHGKQWPITRSGSRITVTAEVGYEALPPSIKHAMLLWIADAYEQRENAALPGWTAFDALLCNYRRGV